MLSFWLHELLQCASTISNEWITYIQPPGLMKMRLMHHQEHHLGHQAPQMLDEVCHPQQIVQHMYMHAPRTAAYLTDDVM